MKILAVFAIIVAQLVGCARNDVRLGSSKFTTLSQSEIDHFNYYLSIEEELKSKYRISNQDTIEAIIQILINEGDVEPPFVVERSSKGPRVYNLPYVEYRKYRRKHAFDSTGIYTVEFDTLKRVRPR